MSSLDARLDAYAAAIERSPHNLLSARGLTELRTRHIPESLAFARMLPAQAARLLDIGSGGGLPGLVIALAREDIEVNLLEATEKKADFLRETARLLSVDVVVHHGRAEDQVFASMHGTFDIVSARAVAPLRRLVPWAAPYVQVGGYVYAIKGERWHDELVAARDLFPIHDLAVVATPEDSSSTDEHAPRVVVMRRLG